MKTDNLKAELNRIKENLSSQHKEEKFEKIEIIRNRRMKIVQQAGWNREKTFNELYEVIKEKLSEIPEDNVMSEFSKWYSEKIREEE